MPLAVMDKKLIVFDIGGVLATIDKSPIIDLCENNSTSVQYFFDDDFLALQLGNISVDVFLIKKSFQLGIGVNNIAHAFQAMVVVHQDLRNILASLKLPFMIASNINQLHFIHFKHLAGMPPKTTAVLSYQVGCLKPHHTFFLALLNIAQHQSGLWFIDDTRKNLTAGSTYGLIPVHCSSPELLPTILKKLELL